MNTATHEFLPEEVMALLDGELSPERGAALSAHTESCKECSAVAAEFLSLSGQIRSWQIRGIPASVSEAAIAPKLERNVAETSPVRAKPKWRPPSPLRRLAIAGSCIAAFLLLIAISVPNLLRSRMAANEASAVGSLRTLNMAAVTYRDTYGHYPPLLRSFGPPTSGRPTEDAADLIDPLLAGGQKSGYLFTYRSHLGFGALNAGTYTIRADPLDPGSGGRRHFSTDQTGVLFADGVQLGGGVPSERAQATSRVDTAKQLSSLLTVSAQMIARKAELSLAVEKLDDARQGMDRILTQHKGYVAELSVSAESSSARTLTASLRVPADQLDVCISELKKLGRVTEESQAGEEVTKRYTDLTARLNNARTTETRLHQVVEQRTGKVTDILEVEKESARVRGEIEQMEAEQKALEHRVDFATIDLKLAEEYKAQLSTPAPSVLMQLRNATVNGFRNAFESLISIVLFFAESGPSLLLWLALLGIPTWRLWRRYRRAYSLGTLTGA